MEMVSFNYLSSLSIDSLLIGAVLGFFVTKFLELVWRKIKTWHILLIRRKIRKKLSLLNFSIENGYMALDHAIPCYKAENLKLKQIDQDLVIKIPDKYKKELVSYGFEYRETQLSGWEEKLDTLFTKLEITDYHILIQKLSEEVAKDFIKDIKNGETRFNGYLYGVFNIRPTRVSIEEESGLKIKFYKTDYFTYRVFANLYSKFKEKIKINSISELNQYYTPLLSSFGLSTFVLINNGNEDVVLLGHRSSNVIVDKNKIHFSMNEAFSMKDIDMYGNPSFISCLFRGLKEELGLNENYQKNIIAFGFLDLGMDIDRFEMGISSYVRLQIDNNLSCEDLEALYKIAQDGELETNTLEFVKLNEINKFISKNYYNMSAGCRATLRALHTRYKAGYIKE